MRDCPNCGERDSMYKDINDNYKCFKCKELWKPDSGSRDRPIRPADADCGDVIYLDEHGSTRTKNTIGMNTDGSECQNKTTGVMVEDGKHIVVCSIHRQ